MNITIYSTPTCPYCKAAKEYMTELGVTFTDIDVSADTEAAEIMVEKSGQMGVPVIDIDGDILIGFNQKELKKAVEGRS